MAASMIDAMIIAIGVDSGLTLRPTLARIMIEAGATVVTHR